MRVILVKLSIHVYEPTFSSEAFAIGSSTKKASRNLILGDTKGKEQKRKRGKQTNTMSLRNLKRKGIASRYLVSFLSLFSTRTRLERRAPARERRNNADGLRRRPGEVSPPQFRPEGRKSSPARCLVWMCWSFRKGEMSAVRRLIATRNGGFLAALRVLCNKEDEKKQTSRIEDFVRGPSDASARSQSAFFTLSDTLESRISCA